MASMVKNSVLLVFAALICSHARTGDAMQYGDACLLSDVHVSTARTGKVVAGQPEYRVTIENLCECPQDSVTVQCAGLPSTEPVDVSKIIAQGNGSCSVNVGELIFRGSPVTFTYARKEPQAFTPTFAISRCP